MDLAPYNGHHPYCNFSNGVPEDCKQCKHLHANSPLKEGETVEEMTRRLYPEVIIRPGT